ncbi:MAG: phosphoadenylyl-sulfate reductase [Chitinophagaceae bacterium]|nr:phosphoadenylyl-sulfate reductase [Chitinophagaceae bacterium]
MNTQTKDDRLIRFEALLDSDHPAETLRTIADAWPGQVVFSTSFSAEDQVITHLIATGGANIGLFTLDTGRLFPETYSTWTATLERYGLPITAYYPDAAALQDFVAAKGPNAFYESLENRKACCHIRKVEPLQRALQGRQVWITGIRAEHSPNRTQMRQAEWDDTHGVFKFHPLLHWTSQQVRQFITEHQVPSNPLHDRGFVRIGCAPCTRAIQPGEDFRAGRWWWEDASKKECGLHVHHAR